MLKSAITLLAVFGLSSSLKVQNSHEGQFAWYTFNEGPSGNRCSKAQQCDGQRTCSGYGWCVGTSRPPKNAKYYYNEGNTGNKCPTNPREPNWKNRDYYCDGKRTCSSNGWCQGVSR